MLTDSSSSYCNEEEKIDTANPDYRYKTLFEHVNAAAFLTTFNGQILEANHKSCDLLNYRWDELLRLSLRDVLPKETDWSQFQEEIAAKGGLNIETHSVCKDGTYIPVEISVSLFKIDNKPVMFVLLWDISKRIDAEHRLKESEKQYHGLFEYSTDGIFVLDARGDILDVNTKLCEMLDIKKNDITNKNLFSMDFLTTKSLPIVVNQFEQLLSEKTAKYYTTQIKSKQDTLLDVEVSSFFLVRKDKEVDNFILIIRDITERNKTKYNQLREHELLKTLMDNIPDSVYFKDDQNRFILVNKAKAEHSNVSPEEMTNKTDFDFLPEEQARKIVEDDKNIMQLGQSIINKIERVTHRDGSDRWVSVTKVPRYSYEGDIIGTMGISRDITLQKNAEDELLKLEKGCKAIFENSLFAIIQINENGKIESWNSCAENMLLADYDFLNQKPIHELYPPEEWERIQSIFGQDSEVKECTETKILQKNGSTVEINLFINTTRVENERIIGYTHIINEISKIKNTEQQLEQKNEILYSLLDTLSDDIYFKDNQNKYILINKALAENWNIKPENAIGKTDYDILQHELAEKNFEEDKKILETGEAIIDKIQKISDSNGCEKWFFLTKKPWLNRDGKIVGIISINRDITVFKKSSKK